MADSANKKTPDARLRDRVHSSRRAMQPFREVRRKIIQSVAGSRYTRAGGKNIKDESINLLGQFETTMVREMASNRPKASITSRWGDLKPTAAKMEVLVNEYIGRMNYKGKLEAAARGSMWGIGAIWQGLENQESEEIAPGEMYTPSKLTCRIIHYSDLILDMQAGDWDEVEFIGHVYRMALEDARQEESFDKEAREKLLADTSEVGTESDREKDNVALSQSLRSDSLVDEVELIDLFLPRTREVVTMMSSRGADDDNAPILRRVPYMGPERQLGDYHLLYHDVIDDSIHPIPPMFNLMSIAEFTNLMFSKIAKKAAREKDLLLFKGGTEPDAQKITRASDGEALSVGQATNFSSASFGGPTQGVLTAYTLGRENFNKAAGNIDLLGGLGAQSPTASQDNLLSESASKMVSFYQANTVNFVRDLMESLAWYLWDDPMLDEKLVMEVPETGSELPFTWTPESRVGDFRDYAFSVEPYSLPHMPPGARVASMTQLLNTVILPLMPAMQQEGLGLDTTALLRFYGKHMGIDELNELVRFTGMDPTAAASQDGPGMPANTTRTEVRRSAGGTTQQGLERVLAQSMAGESGNGNMIQEVG
jgi:hypothetical protein